MSGEVGCWSDAGSLVCVSVLRIPNSLSAIASAIWEPLASCTGENHVWSCALMSPRMMPTSFGSILFMSGEYPGEQLLLGGM